MIKMNNVVKRFGSHTVLSNVTFQVKEREIFGLLGPSGAGKTTIIILANIIVLSVLFTLSYRKKGLRG